METASTAYGDLYCPPWDNFIGASLREYGYYCNVEQKFHNQLCAMLAATHQTPGLIVDIGAHFGSMTIAMAEGLKEGYSMTTGGEHVIVAVEPQPNNYAVLCANLARNDMLFNPVVPVHGAIADVSSVIHVPFLDSAKPFNSGAVSLSQWKELGNKEHASSIATPIGTLSNLIEGLDMESRELLYVKADVEGTELNVIQEALEIGNPVMFIECNTPENLARIKTYFLDAQSTLEDLYRVYWMAEPYYIETQDRKNIWNREIWSVNLMFIPKWFNDKYAFDTDALPFSMDDTMESVVNGTREVIRSGKKAV
jgi:FkbM family methyltransferase